VEVLPSALFGTAGLLLIGVGLVTIVRARRFRAHALRAPGVVVGQRRVLVGYGTKPTSTRYYPTLAFRTSGGREIRAESDINNTPPVAEEGTRVTVLYDPRDPTRVRIDDLANRGGCLGPLYIGFGALFVAIGGVLCAALGSV